jgi:hypothetical protein
VFIEFALTDKTGRFKKFSGHTRELETDFVFAVCSLVLSCDISIAVIAVEYLVCTFGKITDYGQSFVLVIDVHFCHIGQTRLGCLASLAVSLSSSAFWSKAKSKSIDR